MSKIPVIASGCVFLVAAGFVLADRAGLLGVEEEKHYALLEIKLRVENSKDNSPVINTRVKCFQKGNDNACTQRDSGKLGIVSIMVPATRITRNSLFFEQESRFALNAVPVIQVMLIHTDYMTHVESIDINAHFKTPGKIYRVPLKPRGQQD